MIFEPIDTSGTNIAQIPVKYKKPTDGERFLVPVDPGKCSHFNGPFEIDIKGDKCTCKRCGEQVGAMYVLEQLMKTESRWMQTLATYQEDMKRMDERSRTKCDHCGKITRISRS